MKKIIGILLVLSFGWVAQVQAQSTATVDSTPKLAELAGRLNFTDRQKQQLDVILKRYTEQARAIKVKAQVLRSQMQAVTLSELDKNKVEAFSTESGKIAADHTRALLDTQREFYRLLSARQKAEYTRMRNEAINKAKLN